MHVVEPPEQLIGEARKVCELGEIKATTNWQEVGRFTDGVNYIVNEEGPELTGLLCVIFPKENEVVVNPAVDPYSKD